MMFTGVMEVYLLGIVEEGLESEAVVRVRLYVSWYTEDTLQMKLAGLDATGLLHLAAM